MALFRAALIVMLMLFASADRVFSSSVAVGEPAPTFALINENGKKVDIATVMDRPTIIYFTHNACHYCTQIIALLKRAQAKFGENDLRIIGINVMAKDERMVQAYKEELDFVFPMFAGNTSELLNAYKIAYVPVLVFVDGKKIVRKIVGHYIHEPELHENIREIMGK